MVCTDNSLVPILEQWSSSTATTETDKNKVIAIVTLIIPEWIEAETKRIELQVKNWKPIDALNRKEKQLTLYALPTKDDGYLVVTDRNPGRPQTMVHVDSKINRWIKVEYSCMGDFMPPVFDSTEPMRAFICKTLLGFSLEILFYRFTGLYATKLQCQNRSAESFFTSKDEFEAAIQYCNEAKFDICDAEELYHSLYYQFDSSLEMGRQEEWQAGAWKQMLAEGPAWMYRPDFKLQPRCSTCEQWIQYIKTVWIDQDQRFTCDLCEDDRRGKSAGFKDFYHCIECVNDSRSFDVCRTCFNTLATDPTTIPTHPHALYDGNTSEEVLLRYKAAMPKLLK
jgi:hypothetical protein